MAKLKSSNPSASRKAKTATPSRNALKKAETAAKAARKTAWKKRCIKKCWIPDPSYTQPAGTRVVHQTDARNYFWLTRAEIATLPYVEFVNEHHINAPAGKSYECTMLHELVYCKFGFLVGLPKDDQFLAGGKAAFDKYAAKLDAGRLRRQQKARSLKTWVFLR
ncbi:hypothetical protein C8R44DRAFT_796679 [Mycena epipterygia]|nr:hypothetical protein C8R44DRAFT_796679 [Mycena epipterygia]